LSDIISALWYFVSF